MRLVADSIKKFCKAYTIILILIVMIAVLSACTENFLSADNFLNLFLQSNLYGIMALGVGMLLICGYFDLSVGMTMSLAANIVIMMTNYNTLLGVVLAILSGIAVGCINGFCVTKLKLNSLVVTLVAEVGLHGVIFLLTGAKSHIGASYGFKLFGSVAIFGVSILTWVWLLLMLVFSFVLKYTEHGRMTYAIGSNLATAINSGIRVDRVIMRNYVICGGTAALAGILQAARLNSVSPGLGWSDASMDVLTCIVLGGVKMRGGSGKVLHMVLGVLAIIMIQKGINMLNLQSYWKTLAMGLILLIIIISDKAVSKDTFV